MTTNTQDTQVSQTQPPANDAAINLSRQRQMYERMMAEKEARIAELEKQSASKQQPMNDDDDDEPYVDKKKLARTLSQFEQKNKQETQSDIQKAVQQALYEERRNTWLKSNSDFNQIMGLVEEFAKADPELAETILEMPDNFERQKLVYKNIKALGLHKPKIAEASIQDKVNANRRSPYYQPSGVPSAPYGGVGVGKNVSETEGKSLYANLVKLRDNLRLG